RFVDLLAYHYERSDNLEKKCYYLRRAGEVADARSAYQTVADYLSRAVGWVEVAGDTALVADTEARWARALMNVGRRAAADSHLVRALDLARAGGRAELERDILTQYADNTYCQGDYAGGYAILVEALALARSRGDRLGEGWALCGMGDLGKKIGLYPEARV